MSDDEFGDLLDNLDDEPPPPPRPTPQPSAVSGTRSGLGDLPLIEKEKPSERGVTFSIAPEDMDRTELRSERRSANALSSLNDLFPPTRPASGLGAGAGTTPAPRRAGGASMLDDLFGTTPKAPAASTPAVSVAVPTQPAATSGAPQDNFDAGRILRLESELERVNRELEDIKRKKREDEEDLEKFWKTRLEDQSKENAKTLEDLRSNHKSQITKLQEEHHLEIERMKGNYDRQLENITSSTHQVGDLVAVVGKVDSISNNIDKIAADVVASTNKVSSEQSAILQLQEERLKIREERLMEDQAALKVEQLKIHELNLSLKELVKTQREENEREKWRTKDDWSRLKVEKQLFKENQDQIIKEVQKEKQRLSDELSVFRKNQNDLLFRVSTERELLEQEKSEFFAKRDQDIKRIKSEAYELDMKTQQVATADQHITEMKLVTEAKYRQLQHLETLLTAECSEIERLRNEQRSSLPQLANLPFHLNLMDSGRRGRPREEEPYVSNNSNQNSHRRSESVRASLKKHYENTEKYAGQKVATVAPHNN